MNVFDCRRRNIVCGVFFNESTLRPGEVRRVMGLTGTEFLMLRFAAGGIQGEGQRERTAAGGVGGHVQLGERALNRAWMTMLKAELKSTNRTLVLVPGESRC